MDLTKLRKKFPPLHDILSVYAIIVFLIYGWGVITFIWKVPSWLYFLSLGEIIAIFSYTLSSSLLESIIVLMILIFVSLILPSRLFADRFIVRGSIIVCLLTIWVVLFNLVTLIQLPTDSDILGFGVAACLTVGLALLIVDRMPIFQRLLTAIADRLTIFLYLWLPLSLVGILVILLRIA